jgi:Domain of unknown function (DUF927)
VISLFTPEETQEIQLFIALLYDWTDTGSNLYKTVTWTFVGKDGHVAFANFAAQSMTELTRLIENRAKRAGANVYIATSTQRLADMSVMSSDGFPKAIRKHDNLVSFKSIYLDIDVGKPGAYATTEDAFAALDDMCARVGLPPPTMEVHSGSGGLHVYWCFVDPIPLAQWLPLAKALRDAALACQLKFDPQVTVNPAGILRVPNTFNYKTVPPTKVRLNREEGHAFPRYGYQQMLGLLGAYTDTATLRQGPGANRERTKNFTEGVSESSPPVSIDDVAVNCAVIEDILERGGNGDAEPLWNLALYAAAFTTDPYDAAHRLGDADPRYTRDGTDKKLVEKINARANNPAAGWPTCESFSALHPACASCPLFAHKKTPFHHARRADQPNRTQEFMPAGDDDLMPAGYWRGKDNNHVFTTLYNKSGVPFVAEVINYPILDAAFNFVDGELLYRTAAGGAEAWRSISVSANMQPLGAAGALAKGNGMYINPKNHQSARDFLVAWVAHLQTIKRSASSHTYGWTRDGASFVFDDKIFGPDKTDIVHRGKHADPNFTVAGELKPWQDAMQLVYGNAPLEAIVATAFAAPLVEMVGSNSLVLSVFSHLSGIGKSTAMQLAQAVWGHPRGGMSTLADTTNSMMKKIGDLRSLPIYWDELRTRDQLEKVIDIVFQVTQGKGKARLNRDITQMEAPTFTTMFVVASNYGIADTVYSQTESTEAGGLRVFEIEAIPLKATMGNHDANRLMIPLQNNFGSAGAIYAEWLVRNKPLVEKVISGISDDMERRLRFAPKERFWRMTMETLLVGATLANHCGLTSFDLHNFSAFLDTMLARQRGEMKQQEYATMVAVNDVRGLLQEMASDIRGKCLIITETIPYQVLGKPRPVNLVDTDMSRLGDVWMQVGDKDGRVRARVRPFNEWLRKRHLNPKTILEALRGHYHVSQGKQTIGAGVAGLDALANFGRSECYDFTPLPNPGSGERS